MALKFTKKDPVKEENKGHAGGGSKPKFLKGADAKQAIEKEETKAKAKAEAQGKAFRFGIPYDPHGKNEATGTFLDGELDATGILDIPFQREHTVQKDGEWTNIICTEDAEGFCPLCEKGDSPALVGYLTILDHTPYTIKKGPNAGTVVSLSKRLFVAKRGTLQLLTKQAVKRDGLTGCTFEITRTGDKEARVGNGFEFIQKDDLVELQKENNWKPEAIIPLMYEDEIPYYTGAELLEMGLGVAKSGPGTEAKIHDTNDLASKM